MSDPVGTGSAVPPGHVNRADTVAGDDGVTVSEKQRRLLFTFPILLGLFICALNLVVLIRIWKAVYFSNLGLLSRANLPNTVFFTLLSISFAIGLALIVYAVALRHYEEWYERKAEVPAESPRESTSESPQDSTTYSERRRIPLYLKWILGPLLLAVPAPILTVWAAGTVEPIAPRPCIDMYSQAFAIKKDNPNFKMAWNDRDQLRCSINQVLEEG